MDVAGRAGLENATVALADGTVVLHATTLLAEAGELLTVLGPSGSGKTSILRAIAGGAATGVPLSQWFLIVAGFGSLFMVAGKRYSEIKSLGSEAGTRKSLTRYSESYLRFAWVLASVMVLISYSLWAFENRGGGAYAVPWTAISIAPFTLGLLQYALEVDAGNAGEPEEVVLHDRVLQGIGLVWLVVISIAVFSR